MKGWIILLLAIIISQPVNTQRSQKQLDPAKKIFIITLDGFRWEEVFRGADSALIHNRDFTKYPEYILNNFWDDDEKVRRSKLMPFLWNVVGKMGQLYGNRGSGNKVNVANPYGLSYPGYSELLTGRVDLTIYNNARKRNTHPNILDRLNADPAYMGRVAAFTSWDVFPFILNKKKGGYVLNSGYQLSKRQEISEQALPETRYDELTYIACREYVISKTPSVVFLSFSGTDDAGHDADYDEYLVQANNADRMISELWQLVQSMPEYAGNTTFLITTDHGRGASQDNWHKHGMLVPGSTQTWFAMLGPGVVGAGEMTMENQVYQKDLVDLVLRLLEN